MISRPTQAIRKEGRELDMVAHTFNPSTQETGAVDLCEFEASLVYRASSGMAWATQRKTGHKLADCHQNIFAACFPYKLEAEGATSHRDNQNWPFGTFVTSPHGLIS